MSVIDLVKDVGKFFQIQDKARIDNLVFQAHYRFTTSIFFAASICLTAFTLIGDPIKCLPSHTYDANVLNPFCWVTHTYTWMGKNKHMEIHPDVGPDKDGQPRFHTYYQWVPFMLFIHGLFFYLPHWIWKTWEGGKVKMMSADIRGTALTDSKARQEKREQVVDYLIATRNHHKKYAYAYFGCEVLNLINTIVTMFIIDKFLGYTFLKYGLKVLEFGQEEQDDRVDPLITVFPRVTKCVFKTYGLTGHEQETDVLCVLPLNNLNEKIYIFLWFWLIILGCITFCAVAYSVAFLALHDVRRLVITKRFRFGNKYEVNELIRQIGVGDFLLLHLLGQNLSTMTFHQLLEDLNNKLLYPKASKKNNPYENRSDSNGTVQQNQDTSLYPSYIKTMEVMDLETVSPKQPLIADSFSHEKTAAA